jgi:glucose-1-phosphate thymidylyltransferase
VYDIGDIKEASLFGVVAIDDGGRVISFEEKPEEPQSSLVAMCFYYFPEGSLGLVSRYLEETKKADRAGDYIRWLCEKDAVYGFQFQGAWYDIGSVESYHEAQKAFQS